MAYDLTKHPFPKLTLIDSVFSTLHTDETLLREAHARGFSEYHNEWNRRVAQLFYKGGRVIFKEDVDPAFKDRVWMYFRALIKSFEPKHEDKLAVCAYLLSEIAEGIEPIKEPTL